MSVATDDLELTEVLVKLRAEHAVRASYHQLWMAVVEGRAPAHRVGKRWLVRRHDLPCLAEALSAPAPRAA
jgi:hypothetical protein